MTRKEQYAEYLESPHWDNFKREKAKVEDRQCLACTTRKEVQLHHMMYREDLETVQLDDTCWLCRTCHGLFHQKAGLELKGIPYALLRPVTVRIILTPVNNQAVKTGKNLTKQERKWQRMAPAKDDTWEVIRPKPSKQPNPPQRIKPAPICYAGQTVSYADQEKGKSSKGGFRRKQLAKWGVNWPPMKGWQTKLHRGQNPNI